MGISDVPEIMKPETVDNDIEDTDSDELFELPSDKKKRQDASN